MKRVMAKILFIISQVVVLGEFAGLLYCANISHPYYLYAFQQVFISGTGVFLSAIFGTEILVFSVASLIARKWKRLLWNILLIPLLILVIAIAMLFQVGENTYKLYIKEHDTEVVVSSHSFLLQGESAVYIQSRSNTVEMVLYITGDDGFEPLADSDDYTYYVEDDLLIFEIKQRNRNKKYYLQYIDMKYVDITKEMVGY